MIKRKFNLFLFDEGNGEGDGSGTGETTVTETKPTFDEFLQDGDNQAEFDRRMQKAINTAVKNAQEKWKTLADDKVSEAEKLARMTKEEKATYRAEKAEKELAALKKQMAVGEMAGTARKMLSEEGVSVPDEIVNNLICEDAESTSQAVKTFAKAFKTAVEEEVKKQLKGTPPKSGGSNTKPITREQIDAIADPIERQKMIAENLDLYQ